MNCRMVKTGIGLMRWCGVAFLTLVVAIISAGCAGRPAPRDEVMSFFPDSKGFTWTYTGFAEYGHKMTLDDIQKDEGTGDVTYSISGEAFDMSGGESKRDFTFGLNYVFTKDGAREDVTHMDVFPHRINGLVMLKAPMKEGQTWSFTDNDGRQVDAKVKKMGSDPVDKLAYCEVEYTTPDSTMPDGLYHETRVFKKGLGVVSLVSTILPDVEFNYTLRSTSREGLD